jgi:hypothetical protein
MEILPMAWSGIKRAQQVILRGATQMNPQQIVLIKLPRLIAALIVSLIIYAAVYSRFVQEELSLLGIAVAFQNGFFWQAVFRTAQEGPDEITQTLL